ncbi:TolC family protein [Leptobacterium sp. I13]|uniref:TolC family protein n=1 Tax=Leptobacterium meishanense TaxID=3128904 RepID=UPI0030EBA3C9
MKKILSNSLFLLVSFLSAQQTDSLALSFEEYLGYVKKYHPIVKQSELVVNTGEATLMKARGGFDPNITIDYNQKRFKGIEYYELLDATFKIPTWYGIELKANFEQNEGAFLNPERSVPDDGLFSAGVSIPIAQGFLINERMATLKKARFFREQVKADRDILVNQILYEAALAYFNWLRTYNELKIYQDFLENAKIRYEGVKKSVIAGDKAAIDSVEAGIAYQNRALNLEQAKLAITKAGLELSNFLWLNDDTPVELQPNVVPGIPVEEAIDNVFGIENIIFDNFSIEDHPKLKSLNYKIEGLTIDKKLKANKLLPKIDLEYNFITESPEIARSFNTDEYKGGISFKLPLFLRKERGDLKLANYKVQDAQFEIEVTEIRIYNKVIASYNEIDSLKEQRKLIENITTNYEALLTAEERKFSFGESSLFIVNSRERSLIDAKLKQNELQNKYYNAKANLFNILAVNPNNL